MSGKLRFALLGRKQRAADALLHLLARGHHVEFVVSSDEGDWRPLEEAARRQGIRLLDETEACGALARLTRPLDVVISYLHRRRIGPALIEAPRVGCFNFHPAPLPELRGVGGYNFAILENHREYGVSVHWVATEIDAGDLVWVRRFAIEPREETAWSLERKAQVALWELFRDFVDLLERGLPIPRTPQGEGRYISRREMLAAMRVGPEDPPELVERKARAFWFPPHEGAYVERDGHRFTIAPALGLRQAALAWAEGRQA